MLSWVAALLVAVFVAASALASNEDELYQDLPVIGILPMEFQEAAINRQLQAAREQSKNGVQQKELGKEDDEQVAFHQPSVPMTDESECEEALGVPARVAKRKSWHMRFGKRGTHESSEEKPKAGSEGKIVKRKSKYMRYVQTSCWHNKSIRFGR